MIKAVKFKIKVRIFLWFISLMVIGWLFFLAIVPGGKISYYYDFDKDSNFISRLSPKERLNEDNINAGSSSVVMIIGDPVYFSLWAPRAFDEVVLDIKYRHAMEDDLLKKEWNCPVIEVGTLVDKTIWRYDLKPIENKIIDNVSLVWNKINENEIVLLQKDQKFSSVNDFLTNLPPQNEIAIYNYDLNQEYLLPDYSSSNVEYVINQSLRGPYQFYTYIDQEELWYEFDFYDLNENKDNDVVDVHLYYQDALIETKHLDDDGVLADNKKRSDQKKIKMAIKNLPTGVYKIEIKVNDDIVTERIKTKQQKTAFLNGLRLHNSFDQKVSLFTDSKKIQTKTIYPDRMQTVVVGANNLLINETYRQFDSVVQQNGTSSKINEIILEKDGVFLSGDGVFSFSQEALLNPKLKRVDESLDVVRDGINYIVAQYLPPSQTDEWKKALVKIDIRNAYRENGKYSFIVSIPGLKIDDDKKDGIILKEIAVHFSGKSLKDKIKELIQ